MADGRSWWAVPPPYTAPVSEFTTPEDLRRARISAALGWDVGNPWGEFVERALPLALGAVRAPVAPRVAPAPAAPGPWQPGFMTEWLRGRYQPQGRPQPWQADRRWGPLGNEPPPLTWGDVVRGNLGPPRNLREWIEFGKGASAASAAGGVGAGAGQFLSDTYHGEPWQDALWRALWTTQTLSGTPPAPPTWWPRADETVGGR